MRWSAGVLLMLAAPVAAARPLPLPPPVPRPPPTNCETPAHRQFDFWLGEWDVVQTGKREEMVGVSTVTRVASGCGILENWRPFSMTAASSLTSYDPGTVNWRQHWVDSFNADVELTGGFREGRMVLTGPWPGLRDGRAGIMRISWTPTEEGLRQVGEYSMDGGTSWAPSFDYTYYRRGAP